MLITKVKVGNVTNLSDARYCAGMGVDFLSFPISLIDAKTYKEITGWVAGPEFGVELTTSGISQLQEYPASFISINAENLPLLNAKTDLIVCVAASDWSTYRESITGQKERIRFIELAIHSLDELTRQVISDASVNFQVLVKPEFTFDVHELLKLSIAGISLDGNDEARPGLKEYPLAEILEQLEVE
jgi:phosphoribosylanthranilate isomerase